MKHSVRILSLAIIYHFFFVGCIPKSDFVVVATTDVHGNIIEGYSRVSTYVKDLRAQGKTVLLFDGGDYLQGTTAVYYSNFIDDTRSPHILSTVFNSIDYTAIAVGNHDIEAGKPVFTKVYHEVNCPVICANVVAISTNEPYFTPYIVRNINGQKVVVVGFTTPHVSTWVSKRLRPGLEFESIIESAEYWVPKIRIEVKPDVLIGVVHSGYEGGATAEMGPENEVLDLAQHFPEFDLICYGHDHLKRVGKVPSENGKTVTLMNPGANRNFVAVATFNHKEVNAEIVDMSNVPADTTFIHTITPFIDRVREYESTPIAVLLNDISSKDAKSGPCGWVDEIHRAHLDMAGLDSDYIADVSFAAALSSQNELKAGPLILKDFFTWFPYENSLCIMKMKGSEIKDYLEYSYSDKVKQLFNFDTAAGLFYQVDTLAAYGERIKILRMATGEPFSNDKTYNVAMNSYRSMGGGGHLSEGLGWSSDEIDKRRIWEGKMDIRRLFMDWEAHRSPFEALPLNYWSYK